MRGVERQGGEDGKTGRLRCCVGEELSEKKTEAARCAAALSAQADFGFGDRRQPETLKPETNKTIEIPESPNPRGFGDLIGICKKVGI